MRVLITTLPDAGCFSSLLPVAEALVREGHDVAVAASPTFAPGVEARGLEHLPAGIDWTTSDPRYIQTMLERAGSSDLTRLTGAEPLSWLPWAAEFLCGVAARAMVPDLIRLAREWRADLVLRDSVELAGCVAAEALGLPHASATTTADSALDLRPYVAEPLERLRRDCGLGSDPDGAMAYRYLHLSLIPPSFDGPGAALPPTIHHVRYESAAAGGEELPGWVDSLGERPLALVNLGMVFHRIPGLFGQILDALAGEPLDVVVATGSAETAQALEPAPPNVRVTPWIPFGLLLPRCDLFVTHGGMASMREAFRCGVPLVVLPVFGDQVYSGVRCRALGLGPVVTPDRRDPAEIAEAIRSALREPSYRERARALQAELESLPPIEHAVRLLERLAAERQPLLAADAPRVTPAAAR